MSATIALKPEKIVSKLPTRPSTGKLLANMQRSAPKMRIASRTIAAFFSALQRSPRNPIPEIFSETFGCAATVSSALRQPASPSALRSAGSAV